jgi:hypothetical protein
VPQVDFRQFAFDIPRIDATAKGIGRSQYWRLYTIENVLRVVVHSVLTVQVGPHWWTVAVAPGLDKQAKKFESHYASNPWHGGRHLIYYIYLSDLGQIMREASQYFLPVMPDVDQWVAKIEQVRLPRNVVGHMNFPSANDRKRIEVLYTDVRALARYLTGKIPLQIP